MAEVKTRLTAVDETGGAFTSAKGRVDALGGAVEQSGSRFSAMGALAGAAGSTALGFLSDAAREAEAGAISEKALSLAVENTGNSWGKYSESILKSVDAAQMKYAFDDGEAREALQAIIQRTGDAAGANDNLAIAMDVARAKGIPLAAAAELVAKGADGQAGAFKKLGVEFDKNASAHDNMAKLQAAYAGQAEAYANTTAAQADIMVMKFGEWKEGVGAALGSAGPFLTMLPGLSAGFTGVSSVVSGSVMPAITGLGIGLGPILLIIGAVAIAAGLLYLAWKTNFGGIQEKTKAVMDWITGTALPMATGFFRDVSTKVGVFLADWRTNFAGVILVVQGAWTLISGAFTTAMNIIVPFVRTNIGAIQTIISGAFTVIKGIVTVGWSLISGIFKTALALLRGDWDGAWKAIKGTVSGVIDGVKLIVSGGISMIKGYLTLGWAVVESTVRGVWNKISGYISGPIDTAKSAIDRVIGAIKTTIQSGIDMVNTITGLINNIPGVNLPSLPSIPGFADGVRGFGGGLALVGERGPELVQLPGGTNVYTTDETKQLIGEGAAAAGLAISSAQRDAISQSWLQVEETIVGHLARAGTTARGHMRDLLRAITVTPAQIRATDGLGWLQVEETIVGHVQRAGTTARGHMSDLLRAITVTPAQIRATDGLGWLQVEEAIVGHLSRARDTGTAIIGDLRGAISGGASGAAGGGDIYIHVAGSVISEGELIAKVRAELLKTGARNLNTGFG